jgi:hypothetical protein
VITALATVAVVVALTVAGATKLRRRPLLAVCELAVAAGVALGWRPAQVAAGALLGSFAIWLAWSLARGRRGAPCGCFGPTSVISPFAALRAAALALVAAALAIAPAPRISAEDWAIAALAVALVAAIAIAFTLAREVARPRLERGGALEIDSEGPALGEPSPLAARFTRPGGPIALAVFVSPGCSLCAELEPAIAALGRELPVEVFDEERDALAWEISRVPGSPYAVALDNGGVVLARGTFNTPAQLRSIPATALYRLGGELVRG